MAPLPWSTLLWLLPFAPKGIVILRQWVERNWKQYEKRFGGRHE